MFIKNIKKDWGKGIPEYKHEDLMTDNELYDFALDIVAKFEVEENEYKLIDANPNKDGLPSLVIEIEGKISFVLVEVSVAPNKMPKLSLEKKDMLLEHAKKYNAECYYAPVGFGSIDGNRFEKSIALRGDGFYANYVGMLKL
ncbi:MAG: hypothetical protein WC006_03455 [Bacilli bacterium]